MALATLYIPEIFMKQKFSQSNTKSREFHFANALNSICSYLTIQQRINPLHCRNIEQTAEIHYKIWPMVYLVSPFITATMNGFSELALVWQFFPPKKGPTRGGFANKLCSRKFPYCTVPIFYYSNKLLMIPNAINPLLSPIDVKSKQWH